MIEYFQFAVLIYLMYRVNCLINKVGKYKAFEVDVFLNIVPMQDDWKPVYNTSITLKKQLKLSTPPIIDAVIANAGNCPARVYQITQLESYLSCVARCEVEQESYENCIALYKELGWL